MKYDEYLKKRKLYEEKIKIIDEIIKIKNGHETSINDSDDLNTIIFKLYIITESVTEVSETINKLGYRIKTNSHIGERKYIHKEITQILENETNIDDHLLKIVKHIMNKDVLIKQFKL